MLYNRYMSRKFNIYCDESCHLENDNQKAMVLGAIWCPKDKSRDIAVRIREIKKRNSLSEKLEVKWTKVSSAKSQFYLDLVDYFFDDDDLHFRALLVPDKSLVNHDLIENQSHDDWYYKMYFSMLKTILHPNDDYRIYLDIKDTRGGRRTEKLHDVLSNNMYDYSRKIVQNLQQVQSYEIEQLQLADLLIGAVAYENRGLKGNEGKEKLISKIKQRSGYTLKRSTLLREEKFNLFKWDAS